MCPQPTGACCLIDSGACIQETEVGCFHEDGIYQGDFVDCADVTCPLPADGACCFPNGQGNGTDCQSVQCPQPPGACCLPDGSCVVATAADCTTQGGAFQGDGTTCDAVQCQQPTGACCLADGSCVESAKSDCTTQGGTYQGDGTDCQSVQCEQPSGACCLIDGTCFITTEANCVGGGGEYQGDDTDCVSVDCPGPGACCLPDGTCAEVAEQLCTTLSGDFQGKGTTCGQTSCPQPTGACCLPDGTCVEVTDAECGAQGGSFQGVDIDCASVACLEPTGACCFADTSCQDLTADECAAAAGTFQGTQIRCADAVCLPPATGGCTDKGSLLYFSKVELRWNSEYEIIQDTFIDMTNDYPEDVRVLMYFVNGDEPLSAVFGAQYERAHPGWNYVDNEIMLTKNEPTYWSALTGMPKGVSPFTVLDPGFPPGRPAMEGTSDRVLRGFVVAWAVNAEGEEIRWNQVKGDVTIVNYRDDSAWEYNACTFPVVDPTVANGQATGTPGVLNLNGSEYGAAVDLLLLDFYAPGSTAFSGGDPLVTVMTETDLTLHPVTLDVRQENDGPLTTKAHFDIWNMNEVKFSGAYRCITCWDQWLLSQHGIPNHFLVGNLQTDKGKARIDGQQSQVCDFDWYIGDGPLGSHPLDVISQNAALLGVTAKYLDFQPGQGLAAKAAAGTNLHGMGAQNAVVQFDVLDPPSEALAPTEAILDEMLDAVERALDQSNSR
jgi:hypothetical protein